MNEINKELFDNFIEVHVDDGGKAPTETAVTNLIHHAVINKSYRLFKGNGLDHVGEDIELYDDVMWSGCTKTCS